MVPTKLKVSVVLCVTLIASNSYAMDRQIMADFIKERFDEARNNMQDLSAQLPNAELPSLIDLAIRAVRAGVKTGKITKDRTYAKQ